MRSPFVDFGLFHPARAFNKLLSARTLGDLTASLALFTNLGMTLAIHVSSNTNRSFK
jgi:hypothetical protein